MRVRKISDSALSEKRGHKMLAAIAAVLLVLWLLGFFAFHVSSALIHVLLVIGIVLLVLHLMRGKEAVA
jgi:protein-S-isoprenylcysteine O-methyltransferase Ste14